MSDRQGAADGNPDAAWRGFWERLAERVTRLGRDEFVEVSRAGETGRPLLIFTVTGSGRVRCTIGGSALTNFWPPEQAATARAQRAAVDRLGWRELRSGSMIRETGKRNTNALMRDAERALREVWKIADPSVLHVHDPFSPEAQRLRAQARPKERTLTLSGTASLGVIPGDAEHLLTMAADTLATAWGCNVSIDDGAIRFTDVDGFYTKLLVSPHAMRLEFCTIVGHCTPDMALLGAVVAEHSSRWPDVSILVTKDHIFAVRALECATFYPINLLAALDAWRQFCAAGAIDIVEQLHPDATGHFGPVRGQMPAELVDLIRRFVADPNGVTPSRIACDTRANAPMLRRYARICEEWLAEWPDGEPAAGCDEPRMPEPREVQRFVPVLVEAIGVAAELNVASEMRRGR
ncbi:TY-Chap domain-containing protein [Gordonia sp. SL306]|uniref:TY-Chap domain-containing protein n=1 Tax=Gordonia sp. SL306 TaxID=2995145 RepID=UPI00226DDD0A|nr:hypothetical protein [Gordonia sp. SL306]WAC57555.1 hypothetical protein OVA31_10135 [Gordonia sp. SL306]